MKTKFSLILLILLIFTFNVSGKQYPKINFPVSGEVLMDFHTGTPLNYSVVVPNVDQSNLGLLNNSSRVTSFQNTIELNIKNNSAFDDNAKVTVYAKLTYYRIDGSSPVDEPITLVVDIKSGELQKSNISNLYTFTNAYKVDLIITDVQVTGGENAEIQPLKDKLKNFIELSITFQEERLTLIEYSSVVGNLKACRDDKTDELVIVWSPNDNAEGYELEYTFADDYGESYSTITTDKIPYNFKDNSTRISLKETYYRLPLLFERGYILFRVRIMGRAGDHLELPVFCEWSGGANSEKGTVNNFPSANTYHHKDAHMNDGMNWQVISTFAEDGKRSDVANYFDGTFRSRQTVTGINLEKVVNSSITKPINQWENCILPGSEKEREVIAGETIYDFQGRPSVNILPTPTNSLKIEYLAKLNLSDASKQPYSWKDFDKLNYTCPNTTPLYQNLDLSDDIMGSAVYYSPNNPNKFGFNAFLPNANGYSFTQKTYLLDNTGKVSIQSNVGETFRFGSGHETKYFYAAPNQEELDRMFGTDVGDAKRYQKNAVIDANGQVSVTYLNPEGKVIATSLSGESPDNLEKLDNQAENNISVSLLDKNILDETDKTITAEHEFFVSYKSNYTFDYSINPETLAAALCDGKPICLDCIYDIDITLNHIESCTNEDLFHYSGTIGDLMNGTNIPDIISCNNTSSTGDYPRQKVITLDIGTYVITKKITVNKQAAEMYVAEVFKDTCKTKWQEILNDEFFKMDTLACHKSCNTCEQPPVQTSTCDTAFCKPAPNRCDIVRSMMLKDVSPHGQYAQFDRNPDGSIDASQYSLSIFNLHNYLPNPTTEPIIRSIPNFAYDNTKTIEQNLNLLVNTWHPGYAEGLLQLHPEFCQLGWCGNQDIDTTLDYDVQILSIKDFAKAEQQGYVVRGMQDVYNKLLDADPWFRNGLNPSVKTDLLYKLEHYGCDNTNPIDELAMYSAYCANNHPPHEVIPNAEGTIVMDPDPAIDENPPPCNLPSSNYYSIGFGNHDAGTETKLADLEWSFLRSFYLSSKQQVIQQSMDDFAPFCNMKCIGSRYYFPGGIFWNLNQLPCNPDQPWYVWMLYRDKERRFGSGMNSILNAANDNNIPIDLNASTNVNDLCELTDIISSQTESINQHFASIICGDSYTESCDIKISLTLLFNQIIHKLKDSANITVTISASQLPPSVINAGITSITASVINHNIIRIYLRPCNDAIDIPFLQAGGVYIAPVSMCCISNISCPGNTNCSFNMNVTYANNSSNNIHIQTKCDFLKDCKDSLTIVCPEPTVYNKAVKDYINSILEYVMIHGTEPSSVQLINMLPPVLKEKNGKIVRSVAFSTGSNFAINITYSNGQKHSERCNLILKRNSNIDNWANVKTILSITPDYSAAYNGITNYFIVQVLSGTSNSSLTTFQVKGRITCFPMNECLPAVTYCDSIYLIRQDTSGRTYINDCVDELIGRAYGNATIRYQQWVDSMKNDLLQRYYAKCLSAAEIFNMSYTDLQYQYTLYYYDQAGNLVKTVPPAGVKLFNHDQALQADALRKSGYTSFVPDHFKFTEYRYNTLNEITWQKTPDAGETYYYFDRLGRIAVSVNALQNDEKSFSYIKYDKLGRIVESGKIVNQNIDPDLIRNFEDWAYYIDHENNRTEITFTQYDEFYTPVINQKFGTKGQCNLRNRISSVLCFDNPSQLNSKNYKHATHYTYDVKGNVYKLIQDYPNTPIGDKILEYKFDLQGGKVNDVIYQRGAPDQFLHHYSYDASNRLIRVETSTNGLIWENDAEYFYYRHGPLARKELGTDKVQGLDYMYTLQGWIKGVNGTTMDAKTDMGQDGINPPTNIYNTDQLFGSNFNGPGYSDLHDPIARDAFGYILDYYKNDFKVIIGNAFLDGLQQQSGNVKDLYNGNISRMYTQIQNLGNMGFNYSYDQLNQIKSQEGWKLNGTNMIPIGNDYGMGLKYDADGNIIYMIRNGIGDNWKMDNLNYYYYRQNGDYYNPHGSIPTDATNKLAYLTDDFGSNDNYQDIGNQDINNYQYDQIGNLISDKAGNIEHIYWNLQNKISKIEKINGPSIGFEYDALGNRVMKLITAGSDNPEVTTFYVRDASGNIMSTYKMKEGKLFWDESDIYGSSRIGVYNPEKLITGANTSSYDSVTRGYKQYELSNHLGNVIVTITDKKLPYYNNNTIEYYTADISTSQDYYPFGMEMPKRKFNSDKYEFGFNGKLEDNEVYGEGNFQDYGFRMYDTRVCRFISVDPLTKKYPELTPFQFASNNPIKMIDLDGLEGWEEVLAGITIYELFFATATSVVTYQVVHDQLSKHPIDLRAALKNQKKQETLAEEKSFEEWLSHRKTVEENAGGNESSGHNKPSANRPGKWNFKTTMGVVVALGVVYAEFTTPIKEAKETSKELNGGKEKETTTTTSEESTTTNSAKSTTTESQSQTNSPSAEEKAQENFEKNFNPTDVPTDTKSSVTKSSTPKSTGTSNKKTTKKSGTQGLGYSYD